MVGQIDLVNKLNDLSLDTLPKSLLLVGKEGCGKHTYVKLIAQKLNLPIRDISDCISLEVINEIYLGANPTLFVIDGNSITEKEEGIILKVLEEPPNNAFIVITCVEHTNLLPTILNRCQVWKFLPYTDEELRMFSDDDLILTIAETPGQILRYASQDFNAIYKCCNYIITQSSINTIGGLLQCASHIAFKKEPDKFNYKTVLECLSYCAFSEYSNNKISKYKFDLVQTLVKESQIKSLNLACLFDNFLCKLAQCP